jgi:hypothetical protein
VTNPPSRLTGLREAAAHQRQNQISTPVTPNSHDPAVSRAAMVCSKLNVTIKTESLQTQFAPRDKI